MHPPRWRSRQRERQRRRSPMHPILFLPIALITLCLLAASLCAPSSSSAPTLAATSPTPPSQLARAPHLAAVTPPVSRYAQTEPIMLEDIHVATDVASLLWHSRDNSALVCPPLEIELAWRAHISSPIVATPVIEQVPDSTDHSKHVFVAGQQHVLATLDADGHHLPTSPLLVTAPSSSAAAASFSTSPILFDYDRDGIQDVVWVSADAQLMIVNGAPSALPLLLANVFRIPKLRVRKNWHLQRDAASNSTTTTTDALRNTDHLVDAAYIFNRAAATPDDVVEELDQQPSRRLLAAAAAAAASSDRKASPRRSHNGDTTSQAWLQLMGNLPEEARASFMLFASPDDASLIHADGHSDREYPIESDWVYVDAHVLATPTLADTDRDGLVEELVIPVSYYFDVEEFRRSPHLYTHVDPKIDIRDYAASGIVTLHLPTLTITSHVVLDLSTARTAHTARVYSSPTVVDLDADGTLEIVIGTSFGSLYALRADTGDMLPGFPVAMADIRATVAVADVNGDGEMELVATDRRGNVVCLTSAGREVWHAQVGGFSESSVSIGDVNGDGRLDVVVGTVQGMIWVLDGVTGASLPRFPLKTNGAIRAPVTLVRMSVREEERRAAYDAERGDSTRADSMRADSSRTDAAARTPAEPSSLQLVLPSYDGHVYIVDGSSGCTTKLDLGERSQSAVLVDDVLGHGRLDLLVVTHSGNVYCVSTGAWFHPLHAWRQAQHGRNGFVAQYDYHGVYVHAATRQRTLVHGSTVRIEFIIVDRRAGAVGGGGIKPWYNVTIWLAGSVVYHHVYWTSGAHVAEFAAPGSPVLTIVRVHMVNEHAQFFADSFPVAINPHYYRLLKYVVAVPFLVFAMLLLSLHPQRSRRFDSDESASDRWR